MHHTVQATINLTAIRNNLSVVKKLAPHSKIMTILKADAYGHGILEVASTLRGSNGVGVARIEEALEIRNADINSRLLLLGSYLTENVLHICARNAIDVVIHTLEGVEILLKTKLDQKINVWLKLDSGMHRLGMNAESFIKAHQLLSQCPCVNELIHMSHFSDSEQTINQLDSQLAMFDQTTNETHNLASLANSAAIIRYPKTHRDWVRPGIILYGANPLPHTDEKKQLPIEQAMTLSSKIIAINKIPAGAGVGYNSTWRSQKESLIAAVGIGYGDGYPRHAKSGTPVLVKGQRAQLVGTVSMDLISIDITDCKKAHIGDEVILWNNELKAEEIATHCDTIAYELFTSVSKRVPRIYIN